MAAGVNDKFTKSYSFLQKSLGATISDAATSLTLNNYTNIPTDTKVHFIIDRIDSNGERTNSKRELMSGICSGSSVTNLSRGLHGTTAQEHTSGAIVEFVMSGAAWNDLVDGILVDHDQLGQHSTQLSDANGNEWLEPTATASAVNHVNITNAATTTDPIIQAAGDDTNIGLDIKPKGSANVTITNLESNGWSFLSGTHSVSTGYNSGNRSFQIATSADHSSVLSPGMRYKVTRNTTPPTQCADLEASSSHYASKTSPSGITFTDDFTCEAWVKLESYNGSIQCIVSRYDGTDGWQLRVDTTGQVYLGGNNASGGNWSRVTTYQSIPLGRWVHIAAQLDMSTFTATPTTSYIMIDGVDVPVSVARSGTNPTALVQAGNLEVGADAGVRFFDGKLADVRVWSDKRTQTEIKDNMYAYPSDTTGLVAHFKLNGDFTDASSNGNNLTAQNSAVATNADNPWNATEYGIITAVSASTIQVFCPEGYGIPNETLTAPYYSTQSAPYGFPRDKGKWSVGILFLSDQIASGTTANTIYNPNGINISIPIGSWDIKATLATQTVATVGTTDYHYGLSDSSSAFLPYLGEREYLNTGANLTRITMKTFVFTVNLSTITPYYLLIVSNQAFSSARFRGTVSTTDPEYTEVIATCAYL